MHRRHAHRRSERAYPITTQAAIRRLFWEDWEPLPHRLPRRYALHLGYPCETRTAFCDFVDWLQKDGQISEALAARAELGRPPRAKRISALTHLGGPDR